MKKILITLVLSITFLSLAVAQDYDIRIIKSSIDYLEVQIRQTDPGQSPTTANSCTDISYSVRYSNAHDVTFDFDGNFNVACVINGNLKIVGTRFSSGGYYYYKFYTESVFTFPTNWSDNVWEKICRIKVNSAGSGTADFEVGPSDWTGPNTGTSLNFGIDLVDYGMDLISPAATGVPYPTVAYDYVWRGGQTGSGFDGNSWALGGNWTDVCDVAYSNMPNSSSNIVIPVASSGSYPTKYKVAPTGSETDPAGSALTIKSGAYMRVPDGEGSESWFGYPNLGEGDLLTYVFTGTVTIEDGATMYVSPGGRLSVNASGQVINILGAQGLVLEAGETVSYDDNEEAYTSVEVASILDRNNQSNFQYGTNGSVLAQTFVKNPDDPLNRSFYIHMVGPRVDGPDNGYIGVELDEFDITDGNTFAYEYSETTNAWVNVYDPTTDVESTQGLILSNDNAASRDGLITFEGKIVEADVYATDLTVTSGQGDGWHLLNNPFASAFNLNTFVSSDNSGVLGTTIKVWNPSIGAYGDWNTASSTGTNGMKQYIRPGQGFFANVIGTPPASVEFDDLRRVHDNNGSFLKNSTFNNLRLKVDGYSYYSDETVIMFMDGGSSGFDVDFDSEKWESMVEDAPSLWTLSADQVDLSINAHELLGPNMVSVPLNFESKSESNYTIKASDIDSFEEGTVIFLEDLVTGAEWHNLVENPVYTFSSTPEDNAERFILHFFGPTGIDDPDGAVSDVQIYAWGQDAYIVNRGNETVKEYIAYDMMGRELHRGTLPNSTVNKVQIGDVSAYYVVKVITKEGRVYTNKVYINK